MNKVNHNNDTIDQTLSRLDWCFEQQNGNNPYPNVSWLFGSDWGIGRSASKMSQEEYKAFVYAEAVKQYK